ncbi:helix-turn-helix domain-containing protein [Lysinibacillus capsici]|uniref:helix-turn-helix domain-containing protein n=1 Tax=Lysinibacillus capsici TaxID=2115968 RepID=UPI0034E2D4AA
MKKIKIKLKELLIARNMTQSQLAELADVRPNAISNLCRGYVDRLSIEHLEKICEALQLNDINELIQLEEPVNE